MLTNGWQSDRLFKSLVRNKKRQKIKIKKSLTKGNESDKIYELLGKSNKLKIKNFQKIKKVVDKDLKMW